jgi:hypothetical protein
VEMFWDNAGTDVDLHLLRAPDVAPFDAVGDCHYANCTPRAPPLDWGAAGVPGDDPLLLRDALRGYGPEVVGIVEPPAGVTSTYRVQGHLHNRLGAPDPASAATVRVYVRGKLEGELKRTLTTQDERWPVVDIAWPAGTLTPVPPGG